jgi:excisionase family DNA binding protein
VTRQRPDPPGGGRLLTTAEVARWWRVSQRTVSGYARAGKLTAVRTPGGQWRVPEHAALAIFAPFDKENDHA